MRRRKGCLKHTHSLVCALRCFFPECFPFFAGKLRRPLLLPPLFDGLKTMQAQPSQSAFRHAAVQSSARNYADRCSSAYFNPKEFPISPARSSLLMIVHTASATAMSESKVRPQKGAYRVCRGSPWSCCDLARCQGRSCCGW